MSLEATSHPRAADLLPGGTYAKKQLFSKSSLISWSHRSRFRLGRRLVAPFAGGRLLDYGAGDGTFLALVHDLFPTAVGADIDADQVGECQARFSAVGGLSFVHTSELAGEGRARYDVITCMEVLEHLTHDQQAALLDELRRLVASDGVVIISVPVEVGPTLAIKQIVRRVAGWRRIGDYAYNERYTARELWTMFWAGERTAIERPVHYAEYAPGEHTPYHGHKGFNWRGLRRAIRERFEIAGLRFSPLTLPGGLFSSQVWFVCRPK